MEPETLEGILKVGGILVVTSVGATALFLGELYYFNKFIESDLGDQIISYGVDLIKYQKGKLQKRPRFSNYKIQKINL